MASSPFPKLLNLDEFGILEVGGEEATAFLHNQFTNDLQNLPDARAQWSAYCVPKGQTLANFLIWRTAAHAYRMVLPHELCAPILQRLQMFKLRSQVSLEDCTDQSHRYGLSEESANWTLFDLPDTPLDVVEHEDYTAIAWPGTQRRWLLIGPAEPALQTSENGHAWRLQDIDEGLPWVRSATSGQFVPQHINMDLVGGVSFSKGCYPGQEVVARMHYRGKIKHRTYLLEGDGAPPQPGAEVRLQADPEGRPCGHIIDAQEALEAQRYRLLAMLRVSDADQPLCLASDTRDILKPLTLPYDLTEPD